MEKIITFDNLRSFAYCNDRICQTPIRGIVICFFGLTVDAMYPTETDEGRKYAEQGILYMIPYANPWAWMNKQTVDYTDEILDVLFQEYHLPADIPIVSTGCSMGGLSALVYTTYAKRTPVASVTNCPVCDLPYHYTERPDLPRTLYSAFGTYSGTMEEALRSASPIHLVDKLPTSVRYTVFHTIGDPAVSKQKHSDPFVQKMQDTHDIRYYAVPGTSHCEMTADMAALYDQAILDAIEEHQ